MTDPSIVVMPQRLWKEGRASDLSVCVNELIQAGKFSQALTHINELTGLLLEFDEQDRNPNLKTLHFFLYGTKSDRRCINTQHS